MIRKQRALFWGGLISTLLMFCLFANSGAAQVIPRISVQEAHERVTTGKALLVCSYADQLCKDMLIKGAILQSEFESRLKALPKDSDIIFYCA